MTRIMRAARAALAAFAIAFCCAPALAQNALTPVTIKVSPGFIKPLGYCQISVGATATTITAAGCSVGIPPGAQYALICNESTAARWRDDGAAPTASVGQILGTGTATAPICAGFSTALSALQFISESSSTLDVSFYQ